MRVAIEHAALHNQLRGQPVSSGTLAVKDRISEQEQSERKEGTCRQLSEFARPPMKVK